LPRPDVLATRRPVTRGEIASQLVDLGVRRNGIVMTHASLSSLGWVVGGAQSVVESILDAAGPRGTICAQVSWEDVPFGLSTWTPAWRAAYLSSFPGFDASLSAAAHYEGRLAERIRTWPGSQRSANPIAGVAAVGSRAAWLTRPHPLDDGFGPRSPYARLASDAGQVLLLGAPLRAISLLHHAESMAAVPAAWTTLDLPFRRGRVTRWRSIRELDVWNGPLAYADALPPDVAPLHAIAAAALEAGIGRRGPVGDATAHLFPARELVAFAVSWLEARFPGTAKAPPRGSPAGPPGSGADRPRAAIRRSGGRRTTARGR
jgi:aminoglycoside 3-N-acetyltransferase